ncbi:hypothetical protein [Haloarcula halobia]|nr:hypothetical protein [Halomicroarcula sp. XH51]
MLFDREALVSVGGYDEELASGIDHDIWMALAVNGYDAHAIMEPLVVTYRDGADSMVTNTEERIRGVRAYVDKWQPTYKEWFGEEEGERYGQRYFAWVIGRLAGDLISQGHVRDAIRALCAVNSSGADFQYLLKVLYLNVLTAVVKKSVPDPIESKLRSIHRRLLPYIRGEHKRRL